MFHSVTINGKNTWDDYHMIPANGIYLPPPPEQKRTTIDLKTGNGLLDVSTVLTGYPLFQNRSGELQYFILDPWDLEEQGIGAGYTLDMLEARVRNHFNNMHVNNIFHDLKVANPDGTAGVTWDTKTLVLVVLGAAETDTAITLWYIPDMTKMAINGNSIYGNLDNSTLMQMSWFISKGNQTNYNWTSWRINTWINFAPFNFANATPPDSGDRSNMIWPTVSNFTNNVEGQTFLCSRDIYASVSSPNITYPRNFFKTSQGVVIPHTMPDPYEVYSQLLADIHGKSGRMVFEDDPNWYYQGNFTVRSMETNAIRRAVSIGYEVAPYKIKTSSITQTTTSINSSSWTTFNYTAADIGSMPVHPKVRVTALPSGGSLSVKFTSPASGGTAITKTITATGDYTWADIIVYNNTLSISYLGSADSGYNVTHIITPGRL